MGDKSETESRKKKRRLIEHPLMRCEHPPCGKLFKPLRRDRRYCSSNCRSHAAWDRRKDRDSQVRAPESASTSLEVALEKPLAAAIGPAASSRAFTPTFAPVVLSEPQRTASPAADSTSERIELVLAQGLRLRLSDGFQEDTLRRLLRILSSEGMC